MENNMLKAIRQYKSELERILTARQNRLSQIREYADWGLEISYEPYYRILKPDGTKPTYAGNQAKEAVRRIQEARFIAKSLEIMKKDLDLIDNFLKRYESTDFEHINSKLPKTYRNKLAGNFASKKQQAQKWKKKMEAEKAKFEIVKPEDLDQPTIDGNFVRSKSEALIYNYLYEAGYTFVYELPISTQSRTFYPDFTILSEIDYKTVIRIEHCGMLEVEWYRDNAFEREYEYWNEGYLPNRDVYFTYDDNRGKLDMSPIIEILYSRVRTSKV